MYGVLQCAKVSSVGYNHNCDRNHKACIIILNYYLIIINYYYYYMYGVSQCAKVSSVGRGRMRRRPPCLPDLHHSIAKEGGKKTKRGYRDLLYFA
jgi:hypothetical protein